MPAAYHERVTGSVTCIPLQALASRGGEAALDTTLVSIVPAQTILWCLHHFAAAAHIPRGSLTYRTCFVVHAYPMPKNGACQPGFTAFLQIYLHILPAQQMLPQGVQKNEGRLRQFLAPARYQIVDAIRRRLREAADPGLCLLYTSPSPRD